MLGLQFSVFLTYIGGIILIFLLGKMFLWPLKLMLKLVVSSLIGGVLILLVNVAAAAFGLLLIPLNILTAVIIGVLGVPGVVLLLIIFLL
ncbi:MAG: pro-sigmaK processing inhibitor BofA [Firmicutes bacterium]|nr:pro-sigmaK processing inhibitor BofA [Bacillota bacterium]